MQAKKLLTAFAAAAVFTVSAGIANADVWNKKTRLTVNETIEVPGATLPPGEYVVKLVDSDSNRHIVQFMNAEEDEVLSTVIAIPNSRLEPTGDTEFEWYETPAGQPPALRAWFYPGDSFGQEFAYPEDRAATLAQQTSQEVRSTTAEQREEIAALPEEPAQTEPEQQAQVEPPQPEPQVEEEQPVVVERERETTVIAQAQPEPEPQPQPEARPLPEPQPQPDVTQEREMETELPETAGFGPLLMLIGLGALGASAAVRKARKS